MSRPLRRTFVLGCVCVGFVLLAFAWGRFEPQTAPAWLVEQAQKVALPGDARLGLRNEPIVIAVAVDEPYDAGPGASVANGARLFVEAANEEGGIAGRPLRLLVYDDGGDLETAQDVAREIAEDTEAIAVIGHRVSPTALAAAPIYREAGIPTITPTATHPDVTKDNRWAFRAIYSDDRLGRFLAHYVNVVTKPDRTIIVSGSHAYGLKLGQIFQATAEQLGLAFETIELDNEAPEPAIERTLARLASHDDRVAVFLAGYPEEMVDLIRAIRDSEQGDVNLIAPDAFDTPTFPAMFQDFPKSRQSPGYYTDGIVVATPLIYDTAGREASLFRERFRQEFDTYPEGAAAYAYDVAATIAQALERSGAADANLSGREMRRALRDQLALMDTVSTGHQGITGPIFFDSRTRTLARPATIGRYHEQHLVSELTQFKVLGNLRLNRRSLQEQLTAGRLVDIGGQLMKKTQVVYTGVNVVELGKIDEDAMTFEAIVNVWFRSSDSDFRPQDVEVTNAIGEIELEPIDSVSETGGLSYRLYQLAGTFHLDPVPELRQFQRPLLGIEFHHKRLPADELIYVADLRGMGQNSGRGSRGPNARIAQYIINAGWQPEWPPIIYQDTEWQGSKGAPQYLASPQALVPFSSFVAAVRMKPVGNIIRDMMPPHFDTRVLLIGAATVLITLALGQFVARGLLSLSFLLIQLLAWAVVLLMGEYLLFETIEDTVPFQQLDHIARLFDTAWWMLPAIYLVAVLNRYLWPTLERRTERSVPKMIKVLSASVIILLAIFIVIAFVYEQPVTSLLATSGLVGLIVGLAVQANISNVFAGIVLSAERPFAIGDVIEVEGHDVARVTNITWRTTRMVTPANVEVSVPNSAMAESFVRNHTRSGAVKTTVDVWLPPDLPIEWATSKIREGIRRSNKILQEPACGVEYGGASVQNEHWVMHYIAYFFVDDGIASGGICSDVSRHIWQTLSEAGVTAHLGKKRPEGALDLPDENEPYPAPRPPTLSQIGA